MNKETQKDLEFIGAICNVCNCNDRFARVRLEFERLEAIEERLADYWLAVYEVGMRVTAADLEVILNEPPAESEAAE